MSDITNAIAVLKDTQDRLKILTPLIEQLTALGDVDQRKADFASVEAFYTSQIDKLRTQADELSEKRLALERDYDAKRAAQQSAFESLANQLRTATADLEADCAKRTAEAQARCTEDIAACTAQADAHRATVADLARTIAEKQAALDAIHAQLDALVRR